MNDEARPAAPHIQAFRDIRRQHGFEALELEGRLPKGLSGTLWRAGPGLMGSHGEPYAHLLDGDGAVASFRFAHGRAEGALRLLETPGLRAEDARGARLYAGFGSAAPSWWRGLGGQPKNTANTAILAWQERLFALWEGGLPTEFSSEDLKTLGTHNLDGLIPAAFSAHPHRVARRAETYNFGLRFGLRTWLDVFALPDSGPARRLTSLRLASGPYLHDFIATQNHLLFFIAPVHLELIPQALGLASFADNLRWKPERGTEVIVVPIDAPRQATRFRVDPFFLWHFANAWDEGETIVADFVRYPDFQSEGWLRDMRHGRRASQPVDGLLTRARISPSLQSVSMETLWSGLPEFPRVDPRHEGARTRALFAAVHSSQDRARESLQDTVLRFDLETGDAATYTFPPHVMVSEPVPAPRSNDDEGHGPLLSLIYDARQDRSGVAVFEAGALADGPVATAWLDQHVPTSFHGCWRADQS